MMGKLERLVMVMMVMGATSTAKTVVKDEAAQELRAGM